MVGDAGPPEQASFLYGVRSVVDNDRAGSSAVRAARLPVHLVHRAWTEPYLGQRRVAEACRVSAQVGAEAALRVVVEAAEPEVCSAVAVFPVRVAAWSSALHGKQRKAAARSVSSRPAATQSGSRSVSAQQTEHRGAPDVGPTVVAEPERARAVAMAQRAPVVSELPWLRVQGVPAAESRLVAAQLQAEALQASEAPWAPVLPRPVSLRFSERVAVEVPVPLVLPSPGSRSAPSQQLPSAALSRQLPRRGAAQQLQRLRCGVSCEEYPPAGPRRCWSATSRAHPCVAAHE